MFLSIIIPFYNEGESIKFIYQKITEVMNNSINMKGLLYEVIFIND